MITASLKNHRQSPRKVRLVADLVRGKKVDRALNTLNFLTKKASDPVRSVIEMAVANAKHTHRIDMDKLYINEIKVDEGVTLMRRMPRARGTAYPIRKRSSHITIVLSDKSNEPVIKLSKKASEEHDHDHEHNHDHDHSSADHKHA